jgi:hypothetical protein
MASRAAICFDCHSEPARKFVVGQSEESAVDLCQLGPGRHRKKRVILRSGLAQRAAMSSDEEPASCFAFS